MGVEMRAGATTLIDTSILLQLDKMQSPFQSKTFLLNVF